MKITFWLSILLTLALLVVSQNPATAGQESIVTIQARAMGTNQQMGRIVSVTIHIFDYSTPDDQKALIEAFKSGQSQGLYNALTKMPSKGRIAITGTLGYDVKYVRAIQAPAGRLIRMITDRAIKFGENWYDTRTMDYNLTMVEFSIPGGKAEPQGTLLPACMFTLDNNKQVTVEAYKNPWKLTNITINEKKL